MHVLVTGFAGYIGPVVVRRLREAGHYVTGLDTGWFLNQYAEPPVFPNEVVFGDVRDVDACEVADDPDVVVHLAALSNDLMGDLHPNLTSKINYQSVRDIIADLPAARHIFFSSCAVYGANQLATETSPTNPLTAYARSKRDVDEFLAYNGRAFDSVSLRLGTVYGYSPGHRLDIVLNKMVDDAMQGRPVKGNGDQKRPLVHVKDVAEAVLWAVGSSAQGIHNVVGENWQISDLARAVASFTGAELDLSYKSADHRDYMASSDKLRAEGWTNRHTVWGSIPVLAEKTLALPVRDYVRLSALKTLIERKNLTPFLTRERVAA